MLQVHRRGVAEGQDQTRRLAFGRADRAEDVGRVRALVAWGDRPGTAPGPAPGDLVLLTDPGFVGEPDLYALACRRAARDLRQTGREVLFKNGSSGSRVGDLVDFRAPAACM